MRLEAMQYLRLNDDHDLGILDLCYPYKQHSTVFVDKKRVSCSLEIKDLLTHCDTIRMMGRACIDSRYFTLSQENKTIKNGNGFK